MVSNSSEALLHELLARLTHTQAIFDFLFKRDPLSDFTLLTSPLRAAHAALTRRTTTAAEPSASHHRLLDHVTHAVALHVPAFSIDGVTVGLSVHDDTVSKRWPFLQPPPNALRFTRFARFDNCVVHVREPRADSHIAWTTLRSAKRKTHIAVTLEHAVFDHAATTVPQLAARLTSLSKTEYCRPCPICTAPVTDTCKCRVAAVRPAHLLDFSPERRNVALYAGEYRGGAAVELFRAGVQALHANLECSDAVCVVHDSDLADALRQRAIRNRLSSHRLSPRKRVVTHVQWDGHDEASRLALLLTSAEVGIGEDSESVSGDSSRGERQADKTLDRREKNRIAAARSNLKRKFRNKSLRLNLVILRQRIAELRERETQLRCEQSWLQERCRLELSEEQRQLIPDLS